MYCSARYCTVLYCTVLYCTIFYRDLRHKVPSLYGFTDEYLEQFAKAITCPHLLIKVDTGLLLVHVIWYWSLIGQYDFILVSHWSDFQASGSPHYEDDAIIKRFLDIYSHNDKFELVTVEGSHHVHLNNPERVVPAISSFIQSKFSQSLWRIHS